MIHKWELLSRNHPILSCLLACLWLNLEWRAWDVLFTPLDDQNVIASLTNHVVDVEDIATGVFDEALFAGSFRPVHADIQNVVAWNLINFVSLNFVKLIVPTHQRSSSSNWTDSACQCRLSSDPSLSLELSMHPSGKLAWWDRHSCHPLKS